MELNHRLFYTSLGNLLAEIISYTRTPQQPILNVCDTNVHYGSITFNTTTQESKPTNLTGTPSYPPSSSCSQGILTGKRPGTTVTTGEKGRRPGGPRWQTAATVSRRLPPQGCDGIVRSVMRRQGQGAQQMRWRRMTLQRHASTSRCSETACAIVVAG